MEPLDPAKNDENSGFSKRRISSILKAPRKSIRYPDPEQQENAVESVKPVEKRNSRRVSFAPANDVLLFSKDVKGASPARSPLQQIITTSAAATQNRVQVAVTEDGRDGQITGMETLLNAPLHASQQQDMVNFDSGADFGEKTVVFSTDDALVDMTHSHTINIINDSELLADISLQNYDILPTSREKTVFPADDGSTGVTLSHSGNMASSKSMDSSVEKRNMDPEFENFLANLFKPSGPSMNPVIARASLPAGASPEETNSSLVQNNAQRSDVDKENRCPASVLNTSRKIGESSYGSSFCPKDDLSMDMTETQTGRIRGLADDDDDPFQCLFPTQEMYSQQDSKVSQAAETNKQQQSSKTQTSLDPKDMTALKNASHHASHQRQKVDHDTRDKCREKTVIFNTDDEFMDMTQSHTVNLACGSFAPPSQNRTLGKMDSASSLEGRRLETCGPPGSSANGLDRGFKDFLSSLSKTSAPSGNPAAATIEPPAAASSKDSAATYSSLSQRQTDADKENQPLNKTRSHEKSFNGGDVTMDMTEAHTAHIVGLAGSDDPFQCLFPTQDMQRHRKSSETPGSSTTTGMETSLKTSLKTNVQRHQFRFDAEDECRERTVRFSADDACMDVTRSHTVDIATDLKLRSDQSLAFLPGCGEKTVRFTANDAAMDVTQSHTVNISSSSASSSVPTHNAADFELQPHQNLDFLPACGEKTVRFTASDATLDMTQCHTVNIASNFISDSVLPGKKQDGETCSLPRSRSSSAHGLNPGFSGPSVNPALVGITAARYSNIGDSSNVCRGEDVSMEMTEAQTGHFSVTTGTEEPAQHLLPTQGMYPHSESLKRAEMASGQKNGGAPGSSNSTGTSLKPSLKTKMQRQQFRFDAEDECRERTVRFSADDACMDVTRSHTVNIAADFELQPHQNSDFLPACGEKTVRFTASDATLDMTQCHTVNIASNFMSDSVLPGKKQDGETRSLPRSRTSSAHGLNPGFNNVHTSLWEPSGHAVNPDLARVTATATRYSDTGDSSNGGTVCPEEDVSMEMTEAQTGHFSVFTEDPLQCPTQRGHLKKADMTSRQQQLGSSEREETSLTASSKATVQRHQAIFDAEEECRERTVRFTADGACMDVTRSHTVNIASDFEPQSEQKTAFLPACGEKTVRFTANEAAMDVTQSHTVNIASSSAPDSVPSHQDMSLSNNENPSFPSSVKKRESETCRPRRNRSLSAHMLHAGFKTSLSTTSGPSADTATTGAAPDAPSTQEPADTNVILDQLERKRPDVDTDKEAPFFASAVLENPVNRTMTGRPKDGALIDMTAAQTGHILGLACTDEPPRCLSPTQASGSSDHLTKTTVTSQQSSTALGSSSSDGVEVTHSNETDIQTGPELRNQPCSPSAVDDDVDPLPSTKSRRKSLADLRSKLRRLSHRINAAPDAVAVDTCTAPLPQLECDEGRTSTDKTKTLPVMEPELEMGLADTEKDTQAQCPLEGEHASTTTTTPFNSKTNKLMSRLSVVGFKPKLPQRSKPSDPKKAKSVGEHTSTVTVSVSNRLSNFDGDVSDIYDEELVSCEDMSEVLDARTPQKATEKANDSQEFNVDGPLEEDVFEEDFIGAVQGQKRPLPVDENDTEDENRKRASIEAAVDFEMGVQSHAAESDTNITAAPCVTTQTTDYSNSSHTASIRCEATFESTFRQSLFESQLEDYANDMQRKFDDGTITVSEFFKLFNIDFVIHNPRQSVLPGRLLSDTDRTLMDSLKDRHVSRPKQLVYETNVLNLSEEVERLKVRMRDLDKPLKIVNRCLWEEVRNSTENELKSFGAKLKGRNNLFRKTSKVQSHDMKAALYSNLVRANLEEQQRLRGTIGKADEMIQTLDDCIGQLETELAAVEEKGFKDASSLKSRQEEMQKVTEALADNERQISELELQKKQNSNKLNRQKAETRNLERHITVLHMVNEWRFREKTDNSTVYTFLYGTLRVELVFEKPKGNDGDDRSERKISHITFSHQFDVEKSQGHARLVHKLLSQYIEGEAAWVEKYPTSRYIPKLLHDVGLVVSRCRLLGEELRRLKMWGALRLDILDVSCVDTQVQIVFSSLKKFSKFEVIFSVSLTNHLCDLQLQSFRNMIGSATIQQIEEIVASFGPGQNMLTKIVKRIHESLLC